MKNLKAYDESRTRGAMANRFEEEKQLSDDPQRQNGDYENQDDQHDYKM